MTRDAHACPGASELHSAARGALSAERAAAVRAHVAVCSECRAAAADEHDSGVYGRQIRAWRARMSPEERRRVVDAASRAIAERGRGERPPA